MRIKFTRPTALRMTVHPGDELIVATITPEVQTLLRSAGLDGQPFVHLVNDDGEEVADRPSGERELAVTGGSRRGGQRSAPVSK